MLNETERQEVKNTIKQLSATRNPIILDCLSIYSHSRFRPNCRLDGETTYFAACIEKTLKAKSNFDEDQANSAIHELVKLERSLSQLYKSERFNNFIEIIGDLIDSEDYYENQIGAALRDTDESTKNLIAVLAAFLQSPHNAGYITTQKSHLNAHTLEKFQIKANQILKKSFGVRELKKLKFFQVGDEFVKHNFGVWALYFSGSGIPEAQLFLYPSLIDKLLTPNSELIHLLGLEEKCRDYASLMENEEKPNYFGTETQLIKEEDIVAKITENLDVFGIPELRLVRKEYPLDVGRIDLLAKGPINYYVIEVKRTRGEKEVVGQISAYMRGIEEKLAKTEGLGVKGIIVCSRASKGLEDALEMSRYKGDISIFIFGEQLQFEIGKCACGQHVLDSWIYCPMCGSRLL